MDCRLLRVLYHGHGSAVLFCHGNSGRCHHYSCWARNAPGLLRPVRAQLPCNKRLELWNAIVFHTRSKNRIFLQRVSRSLFLTNMLEECMYVMLAALPNLFAPLNHFKNCTRLCLCRYIDCEQLPPTAIAPFSFLSF